MTPEPRTAHERIEGLADVPRLVAREGIVSGTSTAALRRRVGGAEVMRTQLQHVLDPAEPPKVTVQVVPFDRGAHAGFAGPFVIVEFPEPFDPDPVYAENNAGEPLLEDPEDLARFKLAFQRLETDALSPGDCWCSLGRAPDRGGYGLVRPVHEDGAPSRIGGRTAG